MAGRGVAVLPPVCGRGAEALRGRRGAMARRSLQLLLLASAYWMPAPCSAQITQPDVALRLHLFSQGYSRLDPPAAGTSVEVCSPLYEQWLSVAVAPQHRPGSTAGGPDIANEQAARQPCLSKMQCDAVQGRTRRALRFEFSAETAHARQVTRCLRWAGSIRAESVHRNLDQAADSENAWLVAILLVLQCAPCRIPYFMPSHASERYHRCHFRLLQNLHAGVTPLFLYYAGTTLVSNGIQRNGIKLHNWWCRSRKSGLPTSSCTRR